MKAYVLKKTEPTRKSVIGRHYKIPELENFTANEFLIRQFQQ